MPKLSVLVGAQDEVLGTFRESTNSGVGAPAKVGFQVGPGQQVIEVEIDDATAQLDPEALHNKIKADYLRR